MTTAWLGRHPLLSYLMLTFGVSWGGILIVLMATGFDLSTPQPTELGLIFVLMLLGPSVSGLTLTALLDGRAGLHDLWSRLIRWKVGARWYAVTLLTAPLFLLAILLLLSIFMSPAFAPRFQWALLAVGLIAGGFEEIGWTGFATPRLLARHRVWIAGLSLGLVWALWHVLVDFRYNVGTMGGGWILEFAIVYLATLTPYRILMTWVYANTNSLLLAVLMHASYTGSLMALFPATTFAQGLIWQAAFAALLWIAAALVLRSSAHHSEDRLQHTGNRHERRTPI
jgi:membrane protease YdiL (CAAX protease family)